MPKLRELFGRKKGSHGDSSPTSPSSTRSQGSSVIQSSPVQPMAYENSPQRQAPQIGDRPLMSNGRASVDMPKSSKTPVDRASMDIPKSNKTPADRASGGYQAEPPAFNLPRINQQPKIDEDFSHDFGRMSLSDGRTHKAAPRSSDVLNYNRNQSVSSRYSEDVADSNIHEPLASKPTAPSTVTGAKTGADGTATSKNFSRHRGTTDQENVVQDVGRSGSVRRRSVADAIRSSTGHGHSQSIGSSAERDDGLKIVDDSRDYIVRDAAEPPSLKGIVDLTNTVDTTVHESWRPAVTHETVHQHIHTIREEEITREIHYHHVYHRILPVIDVQVLPARHFVPINDQGDLAEISEDQIPGRTGEEQDWIIAETVSKMVPATTASVGSPRHFTARRFDNGEGDYKEYIGEDGIPRTETTWVHPPVLEDGARLTGQSAPFYFESDIPAHDGLRIDVPARRVSGPRPSTMQTGDESRTNREELPFGQKKGDRMVNGHSRRQTALDSQAPAVPPHREELPYRSSRLL